jgi:glycosyltransferase involved in cell wall biosynthesis
MSEFEGSICYIVPSYAADASSHMAHLPRFLSEVGKYCELHVIIQRGRGQPQIPNVRSVYVQQPGNHLQRAIELIQVAYRLRRQGCKKFFVRISASAALELNLLSRFLGLQVYYWMSGQGKDLKPAWREGVRRRLYYEFGDWLLHINIRLAHRFVTGPESMVKYFAKEYRADTAKTIVLYNNVNLQIFKPLGVPNAKENIRQDLGLPVNCPILLFVGRVSPYKGGPYLVPMASLLQERLANVLLVVVGDIHMPHVVELASQTYLRNIRFVGSIPNTQVVQYYQVADVFIMPSNSEGFPRVLLEAMACGLPVVAFDVGGVRDILGPKQQEFVVPRGNLEAFVSRAIELIQQPNLRQALAEENLQNVQRYSMERVARMFVERIVGDGR